MGVSKQKPRDKLSAHKRKITEESAEITLCYQLALDVVARRLNEAQFCLAGGHVGLDLNVVYCEAGRQTAHLRSGRQY